MVAQLEDSEGLDFEDIGVGTEAGGAGGVAATLRKLYADTPLGFVINRLLSSIPVLVGVSFIVFLLLNVLPGGTVASILGDSSTPKLIHELTIKLGLNKPFFVRYFDWLRAVVLHGSFGNSLVNGVPVNHTIAVRLPVTAEIGGFAFVEALIFAIPVALIAAARPRGFVDRMNVVISMFGFSCPQFVFALLLILVFADHLGLFPSIGFTPISQGLWTNLHGIILPATAIALPLFCGYTRVLRADVAQQLDSADYVLLARAKGLPRRVVVVRHAFRNGLFNFVTLTLLNVGFILGGQVLIEQIFGIPGMGLLLLQSIDNKDVVTVQAVVVVLASMVVITNLLGDLLYAVLDPRVRTVHGRD